MFRLRHCGRKLQRARAPVRLRADGPLLLALPRRPRPERLPAPGRQGAGGVRGPGAREALLAEIDEQMREAAAAQRYERAAALLRRKERLELGCVAARGDAAGDPRAPAARARPAPVKERWDAFWIVRRPRGRLGAAARSQRAGRAHRGGARPRPPGAAAACRPARSTRSGSWRAGWPSTSRASYPLTRRRPPPP